MRERAGSLLLHLMDMKELISAIVIIASILGGNAALTSSSIL